MPDCDSYHALTFRALGQYPDSNIHTIHRLILRFVLGLWYSIYKRIAPQVMAIGSVPLFTQHLFEERGSHVFVAFFCHHSEPFLDRGNRLLHGSVQYETRGGNCPETRRTYLWESLRK